MHTNKRRSSLGRQESSGPVLTVNNMQLDPIQSQASSQHRLADPEIPERIDGHLGMASQSWRKESRNNYSDNYRLRVG